MNHISNERAIEVLELRSKFVADVNVDAIISYKMAIEALEKQMPRKPMITRVEYEDVKVCPHCQSRQPILDRTSYCAECGQRIDWTK